MAKTRRSNDVDCILKNWERMGMKEMSKGQRVSIKNVMLGMSQEELARLANDKKKPIYIVNIARGLLGKRAFENQEGIEERLDGKIIKNEVTGKDGEPLDRNFIINVVRTKEDIEEFNKRNMHGNSTNDSVSSC